MATIKKGQYKKTPDSEFTHQELEILLSLQQDFSGLHHSKALIKSVQHKLKELFHTEDVFICILNEGGNCIVPLLRMKSPGRNNSPAYDRLLETEIPVADGVLDTIFTNKKSAEINLIEITESANPPLYGPILLQEGITEGLCCPVMTADRPVGLITCWARTPGNFNDHHHELLRKVADQIALLAINLKEKEEIISREISNQKMLQVSNAIAAIRNKTDLEKVLSDNLPELIAFDDAVIVTYNQAKEVYKVYAYHTSPARHEHPMFNDWVKREYPVDDNNISSSHVPMVLDIGLIAKYGKSQVEFIHQAGIREMAVVKLTDGDKLIGTLSLLSEKTNVFSKASLDLMRRVSYQLSIAVAKLLALEDIQAREKEKTMLHELSNEIAAIRRKNGLFRLAAGKFSEVFNTTMLGIGIIKTGAEFFEVFVPGKSKEENVTDDRPQFSVTVKFLDEVNATYGPAYLKGAALDLLPPDFRKFIEKESQNLAVIKLKIADETIGCLFMACNLGAETRERNRGLLMHMAAQFTVALANLLANEKISLQLLEISRYKEQLEEEKSYLQEEVSARYGFTDIIGSSKAMQEIFSQLSMVAFANSTVLLLGETGTGKELVARAIHNQSPRKEKLMVKINCAALPASLIESELFGHERGSFTGAIEKRIGKFELAHEGTLFLDEIGEMPLELQVKLLRAIQEREIERIGGKGPVKINVRIIAATNRNLLREVEEGRFRSDLFYRLNVFPITLPPLRDRKEDIPVLAQWFVNRYARSSGKKIKGIAASVLKQLEAYSWPGNVRELEYLIERSVLTATDSVIKEVAVPVDNRPVLKKILKDDYLKTHEENERDHILHVLEKCKGKIYGPGGAAGILGLQVSTLNSKMKKLGILKKQLFTSGNDEEPA